MTNTSGNLTYRAEFDPYGKLLYEWSATPNQNTKKFTGYERDAGSGLDYAQARMYGSEWGRFLSPDPKGLKAANKYSPKTLNRYNYVDGDPVNMVDPTGLDPDFTVSWTTVNGVTTYGSAAINGGTVSAGIDFVNPSGFGDRSLGLNGMFLAIEENVDGRLLPDETGGGGGEDYFEWLAKQKRKFSDCAKTKIQELEGILNEKVVDKNKVTTSLSVALIVTALSTLVSSLRGGGGVSTGDIITGATVGTGTGSADSIKKSIDNYNAEIDNFYNKSLPSCEGYLIMQNEWKTHAQNVMNNGNSPSSAQIASARLFVFSNNNMAFINDIHTIPWS